MSYTIEEVLQRTDKRIRAADSGRMVGNSEIIPPTDDPNLATWFPLIGNSSNSGTVRAIIAPKTLPNSWLCRHHPKMRLANRYTSVMLPSETKSGPEMIVVSEKAKWVP
jgi:hypothetical protein